MGDVFSVFLCLFVDFWSLEVTFSMLLVSLGRLWTCLVPGGSREPTLSKSVSPLVAILAPFWSHFFSKIVMCLRCFFRCFFGCFFYGC